MALKKIGRTTWIVILACVLLIAAEIILGRVLIGQSREATRLMLRDRMLEIANTAADLLDGDELGRLTAEDVGSPEYQRAMNTLTTFKNNIYLDYIYCVHKAGDKRFVFTFDPDPKAPGKFGQPVAYTEALNKASTGVSTVDDTPYVDSWGTFYSAYSPVFDSQGKVTGIVAVDVNAAWMDSQSSGQIVILLIASLLSLAVGALIMLTVNSRLRQKFHGLYNEMNSLVDAVENLTRMINRPAGETGDTGTAILHYYSMKQIGEVHDKIKTAQKELQDYIDFTRRQAYRDGMTGVGSKTAYLEQINRLNREIKEHAAVFSVAVFDVNGLKSVNDSYGHEYGDQLIKDAAEVISQVFGKDSVYRIGGDEFIAVLDKVGESRMQELFAQSDKTMETFNAEHPDRPRPLVYSKGFSVFHPRADGTYQDVFRRADENMYADKTAYYLEHGDRRKRQTFPPSAEEKQ